LEQFVTGVISLQLKLKSLVGSHFFIDLKLNKKLSLERSQRTKNSNFCRYLVLYLFEFKLEILRHPMIVFLVVSKINLQVLCFNQTKLILNVNNPRKASASFEVAQSYRALATTQRTEREKEIFFIRSRCTFFLSSRKRVVGAGELWRNKILCVFPVPRSGAIKKAGCVSRGATINTETCSCPRRRRTKRVDFRSCYFAPSLWGKIF
jgi:hypothetical protein